MSMRIRTLFVLVAAFLSSGFILLLGVSVSRNEDSTHTDSGVITRSKRLSGGKRKGWQNLRSKCSIAKTFDYLAGVVDSKTFKGECCTMPSKIPMSYRKVSAGESLRD